MPFIGGIVAPNQGLFPEYDAGVFGERGTTIIVSRGIGNSIISVRLNNRPEIVIVVATEILINSSLLRAKAQIAYLCETIDYMSSFFQ